MKEITTDAVAEIKDRDKMEKFSKYSNINLLLYLKVLSIASSF